MTAKLYKSVIKESVTGIRVVSAEFREVADKEGQRILVEVEPQREERNLQTALLRRQRGLGPHVDRFDD